MNKKITAGIIGVAALGLMTAANAASYGESASNGWSVDTVKEERDLATFTRIKVKGAIKLEVTGGKDQSVFVEVDEDFAEQLITTVEDDTLTIDMYSKGKKRRWKGPKIDVKISLQTLEAIELDGAMDGSFKNLNGSDLDVDISGAGNLSIEGTCGTLRVRLSGAGNIEAEDFKCKNAEIKLSGAGNIEAYASEKADVRLAGIGNIDITGSPKDVTKKKGGFGSIDIR